MTDAEHDFEHFFRAASGFRPYKWQVKVATEGLPEVLPIETGLGKTEGSVLGWAWRRLARGDRTEPLHLVYCLPMRSLVGQTTTRLQNCFDRLKCNESIDVSVYQVMGGDAEDAWTAKPDDPWVLVGTQDMLLSRALNRGYGVRRFDWPVHFGLLNQDCHWIVDEVQLMGPGLWTTAQLDWMRCKRFPGIKRCRTTWMSATIGAQFLQTTDRKNDGCDGFAAFDPELQADANEELQRRRAARRPITLGLPAHGRGSHPRAARQQTAQLMVERIASEARAAHVRGTLTLIVCNTVKTAQGVFQAIEECDATKILLTSRFRAGDRRDAERTLRAFEARRSADSGGRTAEPDPGVICVSTQVVEAGFDISAHRLWTEHAPWPSLVQRLGRLNRDGKDDDARAFVWKLAPKNRRRYDGETWIGPYRESALRDAWKILEELAPLSEQHSCVGSVAQVEAQRPEMFAMALAIAVEPCPRALDVHGLFSTEPDLFGGFTDVSRFVRNADPDADVIVFWREWEHGAPLTGDKLDGPPLDVFSEGCAVSLWHLQEFLKTPQETGWVWNDRDARWSAISPGELKPGMTVLLHGKIGGYSRSLGWTGDPRDRLTGLPRPGSGNSLRDDPRSEAGYWTNLSSHLEDARREAEGICDNLAIQVAIRTAVIEAAGLHDLGKAHPSWRAAVPEGGPFAHEPVAKFPEILRVEVQVCDAENIRAAVTPRLVRATPLPDEAAGDANVVRLRWALARPLDSTLLKAIREFPAVRWARRKAFRPGMRHEAASALALWHEYWTSTKPSYPALTVYLTAAHHGKVRTVLKAISGEGADVFGVGRTPEALRFKERDWPMNFSVALDGAEGEWTTDGFLLTGRGWTSIVADLLGPWRGKADDAWTGAVRSDEPRALGPFALAWLEALVRVADWRASDRPSRVVCVGD